MKMDELKSILGKGKRNEQLVTADEVIKPVLDAFDSVILVQKNVLDKLYGKGSPDSRKQSRELDNVRNGFVKYLQVIAKQIDMIVS